VQQRTARVAIGASTARKMGPAGTVAAARNYLANIDLAQFAHANVDANQFNTALDMETANLQAFLPVNGRHWGSSRKFLNIFLRDAVYNSYLREFYHLHMIENLLEVPLDKNVGNRLRCEPEGVQLPVWPGVINIDAGRNRQYQAVATLVGARLAMAVCHLDLLYW